MMGQPLDVHCPALDLFTQLSGTHTCPEWSSCFRLGDREGNSTHPCAEPHPVPLRSLSLPLLSGWVGNMELEASLWVHCAWS